MMRSVVVLWLIACQGSPGGSAAPAVASDPLQRARDYERGTGVARDYAKAAAIYRERCNGGKGDMAACRRLLDATIAARGVDRDVQAAIQLALAMCQRDDLFGCLLEGETTQANEALGAKIERLLAVPCDAEHRTRCEIARDPYKGFSQSGTVEYENHVYDQAGCRLGVIEACARLRYATGEAHDEAVKQLTPLCARGDVEACEGMGSGIPARMRCDAHDYAACLTLGCAGDAAAAEAALANHAGTCASAGTAEPVASDIVPSARAPLDSLAFRPVGATGYTVHNLGTRPITAATGEIYGYDAAGTQVMREHFELRDVLAPGAGTLLTVRGGAATREPCLSSIVFDDGVGHHGRCPMTKPAKLRYGNGRDSVELTTAFHDVPFHAMYGLDEVLALPFELAHPGIVVHPTSDAQFTWASESTEPFVKTQWAKLRLVLPFALEPTSIVYRLNDLPGLRFSAPTLAAMFAGAIKRWNDPAIARDNPGRTLPDLAIKVLQPQSPSDEVRVTRYLARYAPRAWPLGVSRIAPFPGAQWTRWDTDELSTTLGALSFAGPGVAPKLELEVAQVQGARGGFVAPTASAVADGTYPIQSQRDLHITRSYASAELAEAARTFAGWLLGDGFAVFEQLGYMRAPITQAARTQLARIDVQRQAPPASEPYVAGEVELRLRVIGPGRAGARVVHRSYDSRVDLDRTAGRDGMLVIPRLQTSPQGYEIAVRGANGSVGAATIEIGKPGRVDATVTLLPANHPGVLHVRVLDAKQQPVANAQVLAGSINGVPTDARGETAIDLHDRYLSLLQVWSDKGVSGQITVETPELAPTTVVVGQ